ncbi:MAG: glycosyltransferase family 4 protein [Planctomycetota bacterium]
MKVVALTRTSSIGPSSRYRIEQYRAALAAENIVVVTRPLFGRTWFALLEWRSQAVAAFFKAPYALLRLGVRLGQALAARSSDADLILIEQQLCPYLPWWIERHFWPRRQPVVLEFDDAIWLTFGHEAKLAAACARASLVIVGNEELARFARRTARQVVVIPTTVDPEPYARARREHLQARASATASTLRVGWIGLRFNFSSLETLREPLERLAAQGIDCELRVISSGLPESAAHWRGVRVLHRPWSQAGEAAEIAACDVGVMPLPDTPWSRGKCGLKLLQFMAAGIPVVASPVGVNTELIRPGENGLLAGDTAAWEAALASLHQDRERAARLGEAGRQTVLHGYSLTGGAQRLAETYRLAASRP